MAELTDKHTIFVNDAYEFAPHAAKEIELRTSYYSSGLYGGAIPSVAYKWLYQKTAWAIIRSLEQVVTTSSDIKKAPWANDQEQAKMETLYLETPFKRYFPDATNVASGFMPGKRYQEWKPTIDNDIKTSYEAPDGKFTSSGGSKPSNVAWWKPQPKYGVNTTSTRTEYVDNELLPYTDSIPDIYDLKTGQIKQPLLQSVEITNEGPFGLSTKVNVSFLIFDKEQLAKYINAYLRPGKRVEVSFGWSVDEENPNARNGTVIGTITTYQFHANSDGSFLCTFSATSKGSYHASLDINTAKNISENNSGLIPQEIAYRKIFPGATLADIISNLDVYRQELFDNNKISTEVITNTKFKAWPYNPENLDNVTGFVVYKLPLSFEQKITDNNNPLSEGKGENVLQTYIRLDSLIHVINIIINSHESSRINKFIVNPTVSCINKLNDIILRTGPADCSKFVFPTEYLGIQGRTTQYMENRIIAAPVYASSQVPNTNNSNYLKSSVDFRVKEFTDSIYENRFLYNDKIYTGAILINVQYIKYRILRLTEDMNKDTTSYKDFLEKIFTSLSYETGGLIQLSMTERGDNIIISDMAYMPKNSKTIKALNIPSVSYNSIVRGIDLSAQIPDSFAARIAIYARGPNSFGTGLTETYEESKLKTDTFLKSLQDANEGFTGLIDRISYADIIDNGSYIQYTSTIRALYSGIVDNIKGNLLSLNKENLKAYSTIFDSKTALVPIKLKFILDGIYGFEFGNALTTNWLPSPYDESNSYFTIYRIYHKIHDHDWITEIECLYRTK